jgi:hypothetical protein
VDAGTAWAMRRAPTVTKLPEPSGQTLEAIRRLVG